MNKFKHLAVQVFKTTLSVQMIALAVAMAEPALEAEVSVSPVGDFVASIENVNGFAKIEGDEVKAAGVSFQMADLKTGMNLRDKHALKYMESETFPEAKLIAAAGKNGKGKAKIQFHGVEKVIEGTYKIEGRNVLAQFVLKLSDFGIKDISFKGAGVADEVKVRVRIPVQ